MISHRGLALVHFEFGGLEVSHQTTASSAAMSLRAEVALVGPEGEAYPKER
jgi:hypothetical protein